MTEVSENQVQEQVPQAGSQEASQPDNNNWQAIAQSKQAKADKYDALVAKSGENFAENLSAYDNLLAGFENNYEGTRSFLDTTYGYTQKPQKQEQVSQPQQTQGNEQFNPFELTKDGSYANKTISNMVDKRAGEIVGQELDKREKVQQLQTMRQALTKRGINDPIKQRQAIEDYYSPRETTFDSFLDGVMKSQPKPAGAIEQVTKTQKIPETAGILTGEMPQTQSHEQSVVGQVANTAKGETKAFG